MTKRNISLIIPVYKKVAELKKNLHQNLPYLQGCEIVIVNDNPDEVLTHQFLEIDKEAILINQSINEGFAGAMNAGIAATTSAYLFFLNSDVVLLDNTWRNAIQHFEQDASLFAISFAQREKDGRVVGHNEVYFADWLFHHRGLPTTDKIVKNGWAEGGACIVDAKRCKELGGV